MGTKNNSSGSQHNPKGTTQGVTLVAHESGKPIDSIVDGSNVRRLAVDANVTIGSATVNVDLESDTDNVAIRNTNNDDELLIHTDGSISIRLKDEAGAAFSLANPLPVEIAAGNLSVELSADDGDNVAISGHATQIFDEANVGVTTNTYTTVLSHTAVANEQLAWIEVTGVVEATARVRLNGVTIRKKRINSGSPNVDFPFLEPRKLSASDVILVEVKPDKVPAGFLSGGAEFFASLQAFTN